MWLFRNIHLKVTDSNHVLWKVHMWFFRKRRQLGQTLLLPTNRKSYMAFRLAYLHLTLGHSKGQGQGYTYFDWISHKRWQIWQSLQLSTHRKSHVAFQLLYLHLILAHSEFQGQGQGQGHFDCEYLIKDGRWGIITIASNIVACRLLISIFSVGFDHFKGQLDCMNAFSPNIVAFLLFFFSLWCVNGDVQRYLVAFCRQQVLARIIYHFLIYRKSINLLWNYKQISDILQVPERPTNAFRPQKHSDIYNYIYIYIYIYIL